MADAVAPSGDVVLETDRLLLRPWRPAEAEIQRELWSERDPRVPPHRETDRVERDELYGDTLFATRRL